MKIEWTPNCDLINDKGNRVGGVGCRRVAVVPFTAKSIEWDCRDMEAQRIETPKNYAVALKEIDELCVQNWELQKDGALRFCLSNFQS